VPRRFRFDRFELDERTGTLLDGGVPVHVQPKTFDLLVMLLEQPGALISREQIEERLWPNVVVTEDSLAQVVRRLRLALGDRELVKTVPRRGYQLVAEVESDPGVQKPTGALLGRERELAQLQELLSSSGAVWVHGAPGVGRTALLQAAGPGLEVRVEGGLWPSMARALELHRDGDPRAAGHALAARGPILVLLDDLHLDPEGPRLLASWRKLAPAVRWVITTRDRAQCGGDPVLALGGLYAAAGAALLVQRSGVALEPAELTELVERLDGNPLALVLAAPRLRVLSPPELLQRLHRRFELLRDGQTSLQAALESSWEALAAPARAALCSLVALEGEVPLGLVDEMLGPLSTELLQTLFDAGWLYRTQRGSTWLGLPHNQGAWASQQLGPELRAQAMRQAGAWLEHEGWPRSRAYVDGLDRSQQVWLAEHADLCERVARGSLAPRMRLLMLAFVAVYARGGPYTSALQLCEEALQDEATALDRARLWMYRGLLTMRACPSHVAEPALRKAVQEALHTDDLELQGWALTTLVAHLSSAERDEATELAQQALALAERTGKPAARASALLALFQAHRSSAELELLERALAEPLPRGENVRAMIQGTLATALHDEGRIATAEAVYLEWFAEDRWNHDTHRVTVWSNYANLLTGAQRFEEAITWYERALHLARRKGLVADLVYPQLKMARALVGLGQVEQAERSLRELLEEQPNSQDRRLAQLMLGLAALRRGQPSLATQRLQAGMRGDSDDGMLYSFGAIALVQQGDLADAERWLDRAEAAGDPYWQVQLSLQLAQAWVLRARGETARYEALQTSFDTAPSPQVAPPAQRLAEMGWLRPQVLICS
jgi:DNA-binding winged helix-turn-helix (wHTH) protein/tetratricopeptide (TPR) repeat protein